jgi:diguanylate cyclase (GGDEF)-like protein
MKVILINQTKTIIKAIEEISENLQLEIRGVAESELEAAIEKDTPNLIILNWVDSMTLETISIIRNKRPVKGHIYILLTGTKDSTSDIITGLESGADDYITVPFTSNEIEARLRIAAAFIQVRNSLIRTQKKLIKHTKEDLATSLLNRRALIDEILAELGRAARKGEFTCSIMIELHNHNELLNRLGERIMNVLLSEFSALLKRCIRPYDMIGRFDSQRFLVFLPNTKSDDARKVAARMIARLQEKKFKYNDERVEPVVSIGISELDPFDLGKPGEPGTLTMNDMVIESFIRRSELAGQQARKKGKNSIEIYTF